MKRGGSISPNGREPDRKRTAMGVSARTRSATRAASFKLTDFADEILVQVYSNLKFKDRQVTRRVCRRLLEFVDESTEGADKLSIDVFVSLHSPFDDESFAIYTRPDRREPESSVKVGVRLLDRWRFDTEALEELLSSLPPLQHIRPKTLSLEIGSTPNGLFTGLMQHLVQQQVPRSMTGLGLSYWGAPDLSYWGPQVTRSELLQAFSGFDRTSREGVQTLKQESGNSDIVSAAACFTRLVTLSVNLYSEEALQELLSLSGHPTLRELVIDTTGRAHLANNLKVGLAAFRHIEKLVFWCRCFRFTGEDDENLNAFGTMIRGMENLQCLGKLDSPSVQLWQHLAQNDVVSNSLQDLAIIFDDSHLSVEKIEPMVQGLRTFAPSLTTLRFRVHSYDPNWDDHTICTLSGLREHPSLKTLELTTERQLKQETLSTLKQELGDRVKVVTVTPY